MFTKQWLLDTLERLTRTFIQSWLGAWIAISEHGFTDLFAQETLVTGASAAALALITALGVSTVNNNRETSSVLKDDPPPPPPSPVKKVAKKKAPPAQ